MTPARARIAIPSNPSSQPVTAPGVALRTTSTPADGRWWRKLAANSVAENSSPRVSSSKTTPMGAPVMMNSPAAATGQMPPLPSDRPAIKYTGIGESANRREMPPSTASAARRAPS